MAQRSFAGWVMAFRPVSAEQFAQLAGYISPEELTLPAPGLTATDDVLLQMMEAFVLHPRA